MLLAQEPISNPIGPKFSSGVGFFQKFIPSLIGIAFVVGSLVFFFVMIIGAIQWITSGGDKAAIEAARGKIANAVIGFVLLLTVFAIIKVIESFFGINILILDIGILKIQ
ncbi:hypothetical protein MUP46_01330 [Patescibacteria group bacterium]|nr:hypothetical protein [Patescibacteria group bacterium]